MSKFYNSLMGILFVLFLLAAGCSTLPDEASNRSLPPINDAELFIYNCDKSTAIGWVKWDSDDKKSYTSGGVDVYGKAVIVIEVSKGDILAITHYKWTNNSIVDFREVRITKDETEIRFECETRGEPI